MSCRNLKREEKRTERRESKEREKKGERERIEAFHNATSRLET